MQRTGRRTSGGEEEGMTSSGHTALAKGLTKQRPSTNIQEIRTTCLKGRGWLYRGAYLFLVN